MAKKKTIAATDILTMYMDMFLNTTPNQNLFISFLKTTILRRLYFTTILVRLMPLRNKYSVHFLTTP